MLSSPFFFDRVRINLIFSCVFVMRFFLVLSFSVFLCGCSTIVNVFEDNKFYYKNGFERVQLDIEDKNVKNIHPVKIDPSRIEGALKLIITRFGSKPQQLFPNEKIIDYSIAISEALIDAESNEDVVFTVEAWYKQKGLSSNRVTSGRIFYNNYGLNLVFGSILRKGNMQETDPMLAAGINPDLKSNPYVPGSRFQTVKSKFRLSALPNSGVFRTAEAKNRRDWLVFSRQALRARDFLNQQEQTTALQSNIEVKDLRAELQSLRRELKSMRSPNQQQYGNYYPPNYRNTPYDINTQQSPYLNQYPTPYPYPNYNQRYQMNQNKTPNGNQLTLKSLESMRERGLISEENYLKKLRELGF